MDIIKTKKVGKYDITLVYFEDIKDYEVQVSIGDTIVNTDGLYSLKKDGITVFNDVVLEYEWFTKTQELLLRTAKNLHTYNGKKIKKIFDVLKKIHDEG